MPEPKREIWQKKLHIFSKFAPQKDEKRIFYHKFHDNPERKIVRKIGQVVLLPV
jgi:hypothetical protein